MIQIDDQRLTLLYAYPDPRFGSVGKVHLLKDEDESGIRRTFCGKTLEMCPGEISIGAFKRIDCKVCKNSVESQIRYAEQSARLAEEAKAREEERLEQSRCWWAAYDHYLQSSSWAEKRRLVLRRANGLCEGCGSSRAVQVHHRNYPQGVSPGSLEWIAREKLFDLIALCSRCHTDLHPEREH
jgi:hypothetical protein